MVELFVPGYARVYTECGYKTTEIDVRLLTFLPHANITTTPGPISTESSLTISRAFLLCFGSSPADNQHACHHLRTRLTICAFVPQALFFTLCQWPFQEPVEQHQPYTSVEEIFAAAPDQVDVLQPD